MRNPTLILTSKFDFGADLLVAGLRDRATPYQRINIEELEALRVSADPLHRRIVGRMYDQDFSIEGPHSVYCKRPAYLRNDSATGLDRLSRLHWETLLRSLEMAGGYWINSPVAIYRSEHKLTQLAAASEVGLAIPWTRFGNWMPEHPPGSGPVAVKGVDTVIWEDEEYLHFGYTDLIDRGELDAAAEHSQSMPFVLQEGLEPKIDIRLTVIGSRCWAVRITQGGEPIEGDWRLKKEGVTYAEVALPATVKQKCIKLLVQLGLVFGAVDLVEANGEYHFLEVNPLGEWVWLDEALDLGIANALVEALTRGTAP